MTNQFNWTPIYIKLADKLLTYKNNRAELIEILKSVFEEAKVDFPFYENGECTDICPFTVFGSFTKGITYEKRVAIIKSLSKKFGVDVDSEINIDGLPVLLSLNSRFYDFKDKRGTDDINNLWDLFEVAIKYADDESETNEKSFVDTYNKVIKQKNIKYNITMGLFWIRPFTYISLDGTNKNFIENDESVKEKIKPIFTKNKKVLLPDGENFIRICKQTKEVIKNNNFPFKNFIEFSHAAWLMGQNEKSKPADNESEKEDNNLDTPKIDYWMYAPGENAYMWEDCYKNGIMGINWAELSDLKQYKDKKEIQDKLTEIFGKNTSHSNDSLCLWQFANEVKIGDVVFAKRGRSTIIGMGKVKSKYYYDKDSEVFNHLLKVEWTKKGEWEHPGISAMKTLTQITKYDDYPQKLIDLIESSDRETEETISENLKYDKQDFLNDVYMTEEKYNSLVNLLNAKYNIILQGAPGVGKTYAAKRLAYSIMGEKDESRIEMIQFHQSYSYEDFIQGYRPNNNGFSLENGSFYDFCKKAESDIDRPYFFIIDEINRGNLSKILGEVMMLIEKDKRGEKIKLVYSKSNSASEYFTVPKNVRIIGMMNTADRSLAMMDYALRRRFAFFEFEPAFDNADFIKYIESKNSEELQNLINTVKRLNSAIENDDSLGEGFRIGHSYFCNMKDVTADSLNSIVEYEIIPLIKEYWFDEPSKVIEWSEELRGSLK